MRPPTPADLVTPLPPQDVPVPERLAHLPRDHHGRLVPWFVHIEQGRPDHRVARAEALRDAVRFDLCWMCGARRGRFATFLLGPMCVVNRVTAEAPCHLDCALYATRVCPFLTVPHMRRRETGLPEHRTVAGFMITRNPGVTAVWTTRHWATTHVNGLLFTLGTDEPDGLLWMAEGRSARRDEVRAALDSGLPTLIDAAQGKPHELAEIDAQYRHTLRLLPTEDGTAIPYLSEGPARR